MQQLGSVREHSVATSAADNAICIHEAFDRQAGLTPDRVAVIDGGDRITYAELRSKADDLAVRLVAAGVGPDVLVALVAERSLATVVGILGILKAGGAYLPLNLRDPEERRVQILDDAAVSLLVARHEIGPSLACTGRHFVALDGLEQSRSAQQPSAPPRRATSNDLAAVVYTSGSTGKPKGVEIPHRAIMARLSTGYQARRHDLQKAPLHLAAHFSDLLVPLVSGGPVIFLPDECLTSGHALLSFLRQYQTTRMVFVPSQLSALVESGSEGVDALARLDTVIVSGETLTPNLAETFMRLLPHVALLNAYGASEVVRLACMGKVISPNDITVGHPMAGCAVYILDDQLQPIPPNSPGEVYIGGAPMARGYRGDVSLSAARFVRDPFSDDEWRMYRTGDLAERLPDGRIRIVGRTDFEVKVHGLRVNLNEVEDGLERLPGIRRAIVVARKNGPNLGLAAYVQHDSASNDADSSSIRIALSSRLPSYMIPTRIEFVDSFPQLSSGKVDRVALARTDSTFTWERSDHGAYELPLTSTEQTVVEIWKEVLGVPQISITDDFFSLAADSLDALRFVLRAEAKGLSVTLEQLQAARSFRELAGALDAIRSGDADNLADRIVT